MSSSRLLEDGYPATWTLTGATAVDARVELGLSEVEPRSYLRMTLERRGQG